MLESYILAELKEKDRPMQDRSSMSSSVVIIGANLSGGHAAAALRAEGFEGRIVLIGDEVHRPYERPPLSKDMLARPGTPPASFFLHDENFYAEQNIELRLGQHVQRLDLQRRSVWLDSSEEVAADDILLCTGTAARRLSIDGADLPGVHYLRTFDDSQLLASSLVPGASVVIVGMGVIGSEVASSAVGLGCRVTCVEPLDVPMARILGSECGRWLAEEHRRHGVDVRLGTGVVRFEGKDRLERVALVGGETIDADVVVVGVGAIPRTRLAEQAGVSVDNGIIVDEFCRTSVPHVYAAGDVANQPGFFGDRVRLETFENAQKQAAAAAASIAGRPKPYVCMPWAWSDQYDLNIQVAGWVDDGHETIVRGSEADRSFSRFFLRDGVVVGLVTVNRSKDMGVGRRLIERRVAPPRQSLANDQQPLRALLSA